MDVLLLHPLHELREEVVSPQGLAHIGLQGLLDFREEVVLVGLEEFFAPEAVEFVFYAQIRL